MAFRQFSFSRNDDEILALLNLFPFEAFQEEEDVLIGFIEEKKCDDAFFRDLDLLCSSRNMEYKSEILDDVNWNQEWESSFQPVVVDDFCAIKATFHNEIAPARHIITIDPKMAFGTGHHETTHMMIMAMKGIDFKGKSVLDHGCGTGILSILAEKCGAQSVDAIDIEEDSYKNTQENILLNKCTRIFPVMGEISQVEGNSYDVILANINRKVLLDTATNHLHLLNPKGKLLMSGILKDDLDLVLNTYEGHGFMKINILDRGNWVCIIFSH